MKNAIKLLFAITIATFLTSCESNTFTTTIVEVEEVTRVNMDLTLDNYGSETTWSLETANGIILDSGGPYLDDIGGYTDFQSWNLEDGLYYINLFDSIGDGICCDYGYGSLKIKNEFGTTILSTDGIFGNYIYGSFEVRNGFVNFDTEEKDEKSANLAPKVKTQSN